MKLHSLLLTTALALTPAVSLAQTCDSGFAALNGNWQPVATAPRDGRTVEMLETYGMAPWYGLFKWSDTITFGGASGAKQCDGSLDPYAQVAREYDQSWRHLLDPVLGKDNRVPDDFDARWDKYVAEHCHDEPISTLKSATPTWVNVNENGSSVSEDSCLFWRPYAGDAQGYIDPTNGAQNTVQYQCGYLHMNYNSKANRCE